MQRGCAGVGAQRIVRALANTAVNAYIIRRRHSVLIYPSVNASVMSVLEIRCRDKAALNSLDVDKAVGEIVSELAEKISDELRPHYCWIGVAALLYPTLQTGNKPRVRLLEGPWQNIRLDCHMQRCGVKGEPTND
jgi:hypothetical protein